jgi:hypothetical protein
VVVTTDSPGVEVDARGRIVIDGLFNASVPNIKVLW